MDDWANDCCTEGLSVNTAATLGFLNTINDWFQSDAASRKSMAHRSNYPSLDWSTGQLQASEVHSLYRSTWLCDVNGTGTSNSSLWLHFSASTLPQSLSCSSYHSGQHLRQRNCVCKSIIIFCQTTGIRVFSAPTPCCNTLDVLHSPRFLLTVSSRDRRWGEWLLSRVICSMSGVHSWLKQLA